MGGGDFKPAAGVGGWLGVLYQQRANSITKISLLLSYYHICPNHTHPHPFPVPYPLFHYDLMCFQAPHLPTDVSHSGKLFEQNSICFLHVHLSRWCTRGGGLICFMCGRAQSSWFGSQHKWPHPSPALPCSLSLLCHLTNFHRLIKNNYCPKGGVGGLKYISTTKRRARITFPRAAPL